MNKDTIISFVTFLIIVAIVGSLFWFFSSVPHEILVGIFVGLVPSGILWHLQIRKEKREHRNWLLRNKEAYLTELVDILISSLHDEKGSEEEKVLKIRNKLKHFLPALLVWGTPPMLRAWNDLQNSRAKGGESEEDFIKGGERFFRTIRKELGHDDSALKPGELWATLIRSEEKQKVLDACKDEVYE
ncbi:MAG: hypothetical protein OXU50_02600 [Gammaproteobacteria bacterium]|nr:hypothetical protein [Gammaproteobacteria bacterium]